MSHTEDAGIGASTPTSRSITLLFVLLVSGCTSVLVPRVEHPPAPEPEPAAEPETHLSIARVTLATGGEPAIVLEDDGRIVHPRCVRRLDGSGTVRDGSGATVLELRPTGEIVDGDGRPMFTLDGAALHRASGGAARVADGRVTFEGSPEVALEVERAEGADDRLVLLLVAALSSCEE